ncbi:MAG: hypothetical protein JWN52_783 [Actinomycetia bacterium]|nr:hypothetical protein [Actinomycetes bacterium]
MTSQKSFKSRVRARVDKTGESYTTARRRILEKAGHPQVSPPTDLAAEAIKTSKVSDTTLRERTGRGWDEWFALLDTWGATERTHTQIARWLMQEHQVDNWSAQNVTVGYEQERGMRTPGQNSAGYYSATGSKTIAVSVDRLYQAFADTAVRERWLPGELRVRTATAPKSFRADWQDGSTRIAVGFIAKGDAKAQVALVHEKLTDADTAAQMKAFWRERLTALKTLLEP